MRRALVALAALLVAGGVVACGMAGSSPAARAMSKRPIKYLVVIFQENNSFDHYFGLYPKAVNPPGEPAFHPAPHTPSVNGLTKELLVHNPNATQPFRLSPPGLTCNPQGGYRPTQVQFDHGRADKFETRNPGCPSKGIPMAYLDGNTVTALWNYAQRFALSDNSFQTSFGQSLEGHINLVSGNTSGATPAEASKYVSRGTLIGDIDSALDQCSTKKKGDAVMSGTNVGDLLNRAGVTWGWFQGGFAPTSRSGDKPSCKGSHRNVAGQDVKDYVVHHEPFQYYRSTANPRHLAPSSVSMVGHTDQANHQYDLNWFWQAAQSGHEPAVSFLKPDHYQDGHPGASDPIDEQRFLVDTINRLQRLPTWPSTAIVVAYDDPGGWYDHVAPRIVRVSDDPTYDAYTSDGHCGVGAPAEEPLRCGYAERLPLLVISPYARANFVDHTLTDQTSILRFIEDNWHLGRIGNHSYDAQAGSILNMFDFRHRTARKLFLDPATGEPGSPHR